jgi:hypothetical protein
MDFDGPLPAGAVRETLPQSTASGGSNEKLQVSPMVVSGMTINDSPPPVIGGPISVSLTEGAPYYYMPSSTSWTVTVSYDGFSTAPTNISGSVDGTTYTAIVPGTCTFTAVTTYSASPGEPPYGPTSATASVNIAPPDTAVKGGAINTPTSLNTGAQIVDPLYVGGAGGQKVGSMIAASVQENVAITWADGTKRTSAGWIPAAPPSYQFYLSQEAINDVQWLTAAPGYEQALWNSLANGATVSTWTQQLRLQWTMTDSSGVNHVFTTQLNTLTWTWVKVSATQWQAQ